MDNAVHEWKKSFTSLAILVFLTLESSRVPMQETRKLPQTSSILSSMLFTNPLSLHFVYEPLLVPKTIRILHLRPASFNTPLVGTFSLTVLDSDIHPECLALSYTWGDPMPTSTLICGRATLGIGSNLDSALRHVRSRREHVKIWIDAICINRTDVPEKNSQVKNMGLVYSRASSVLVWLGLDFPEEEGGLSDNLAFGAAKKIVSGSNLAFRVMRMVPPSMDLSRDWSRNSSNFFMLDQARLIGTFCTKHSRS